jgi:hypothetical protein
MTTDAVLFQKETAVMNETVVARAFNEWMRRYTEEPERFEAEMVTVERFLAEQAGGIEPTYGETSARYLLNIIAEIGIIGEIEKSFG